MMAPLQHNLAPSQNDKVDVADELEFSFASRHFESSPVSADDIFYNGQIRPTYPLFHLNALAVTSIPPETAPLGARRRGLPLRKLMLEERETLNDANQLHGVPAGTYCVWTPPCKNTTSSSNRWKLRNLLLRSHSNPAKRTTKHATPAKFSNAKGLARISQPFST